jgi:GLPGLI family protein
MKKLSLLLLVFAFIFVSNNSFAAKKKPFKGKVTYQISYDGGSLPEGAAEMMPKVMTMSVGENKTKTVLFTGMGKQTVIFDLKEKTKTAFMEIMGKKFGIKSSLDEIRKEETFQPEATVAFLNETKEIAGYPCKKLKVTLKDRSTGDTTVTFAWFTDELEVNPDINFSNAMFSQVKGLLMEYQLDTGQGMIMTFTATEVDKKRVSEKEFESPEGYEMTNKENLMKELQGM